MRDELDDLRGIQFHWVQQGSVNSNERQTTVIWLVAGPLG